MQLNSKSLLTIISLFIFPVSADANCEPLLEFESGGLRSEKIIDFCEKFDDKVLLLVNIVNQYEFTPQFKDLEVLYQKYKNQGLEIVDFRLMTLDRNLVRKLRQQVFAL